MISKFISMFPEDIIECTVSEKYTGNSRKAQQACLIFCRYNNGAIYVVKNRAGDIGYVTEERLISEILTCLQLYLSEKIWRCKEKVGIFLNNERVIE